MRIESIGIRVAHPLEEDFCAKIVVECKVCCGEAHQVFRLQHSLPGRTDITSTDMMYVQQMVAQLFDLVRIQVKKGYLEVPVRGLRTKQVPLEGIITMKKVQ